ncbi:MAG: cyclase family protein [Steroidobacterales bacterium]
MLTRWDIAGRTLLVDFQRPLSLARTLEFEGATPSWFGAPAAHDKALMAGTFSGSVAAGASCNCRTITLTPHCHGTHTECVGHLTLERADAHRVVPQRFLPALLISVPPERALGCHESTDPAPRPQDQLITRRLIEAAWPADAPLAPQALVLRSLPNDPEKFAANTAAAPPYLTREAALWLVARGIEHLVLDLPSADRIADDGRLTAHRIFFGLPAGSARLAEAQRSACTITELAYVADGIRDGAYLLSLQTPAIAGDAVPSRPVLYAARAL